MRNDNFLHSLIAPLTPSRRKKDVFHLNPTIAPVRTEPESIEICVYNYNANKLEDHNPDDVSKVYHLCNNENISWVNIDGLRKKDVEAICEKFGIHYLIMEDILSIGQRPKMDEIDGVLYCLLNMLYYNEQHFSVEQEQISVVFGKNFVITFQEDATRDVFTNLRDKLKVNNSKIRQRGADYLCYSLLDMIVDHYFVIMEKLGEKIEALEEDIIRYNSPRSLARINSMRKEVIVLKKNVIPVRDLVSGLIKSESELLDDNNTKYFKDVYDHITQASDQVENYRDMLSNLQDLYISRVNLKMNEVMKVMAIVTCLLAPATVIGGIFGMNFDLIPFAHEPWGFYATVAFMLIVPIILLIIFIRRGWFK